MAPSNPGEPVRSAQKIVDVLSAQGVQYVFGVPGAFLWGLVATICSVLPVIGTTPVTAGAARPNTRTRSSSRR